ncbi:MAG: hypothetical protein PHS14_17545, partial [Elusimicrobia bacterium]|nr:hypothetical protein [Elusimicrobiota bacterium]
YLCVLAAFTYVGIIHSAIPDGSMYWPWTLPNPARQIPYQFGLGYVILALMMFTLSYTKESREPARTTAGH